MEKLSIIIPSRNETYLDITLKDLLAKAGGEIEIIVVLNGQTLPYTEVGGITYITHDEPVGMRYAINAGVKASTGEYVMKIDAHCIVDKDFDLKLIKDHQEKWIQVPRRYKLNEEEWEPNFQEWIDYEYWIWPQRYKPASLHGFRWHDKTEERKDILIDDILTFQGSFWFMTRAWWDKCDFMNDEGYNMLHAQEAAYLGTTTWMAGGRVVVNKNTWYAHLHKQKGTRGYHMDMRPRDKCYQYSYNHWVNEKKEGFIKLIEQFLPMPRWPDNWKEKLWTD